jgi:hypothetical protein
MEAGNSCCTFWLRWQHIFTSYHYKPCFASYIGEVWSSNGTLFSQCTSGDLLLSIPIENYHDKEMCRNPWVPYQWCMIGSHSHLVQAWPNKHLICSAPKYACPLCLQLITMHQHFCIVQQKGITKLPWAKGMQFMKLPKFNPVSAICDKLSWSLWRRLQGLGLCVIVSIRLRVHRIHHALQQIITLAPLVTVFRSKKHWTHGNRWTTCDWRWPGAPIP